MTLRAGRCGASTAPTCGRPTATTERFEVIETRGHVIDGRVAHFQVTLKIGFKIER